MHLWFMLKWTQYSLKIKTRRCNWLNEVKTLNNNCPAGISTSKYIVIERGIKCQLALVQKWCQEYDLISVLIMLILKWNTKKYMLFNVLRIKALEEELAVLKVEVFTAAVCDIKRKLQVKFKLKLI